MSPSLRISFFSQVQGLIGPYARTKRVGQMLLALSLLNVADLCFTIWAYQYTPFNEANPIGRLALSHGIGCLVAMKLTLAGVGVGIFWHLRAHARAEFALWAILATYVLLAVHWCQYTQDALAMAM